MQQTGCLSSCEGPNVGGLKQGHVRHQVGPNKLRKFVNKTEYSARYCLRLGTYTTIEHAQSTSNNLIT